MSIVRTYDVFCDGVQEDGSLCPRWCEGASTTASSAAAREMARDLGWVRRKGRDLCPHCAVAGR